MKDFSDSSLPESIKMVEYKNPLIQPDDVLTITIQTIDNEVTALLNSGNGTTGISGTVPVLGTTGSSQAPNGYLVDKDGFVELPFVGKVKVGGLTTASAKEEIRKQVDRFFNDPVINVRFANYKVTVLGEVVRPASYIIPNEKINIFDALGMAGDMTIFARRENVMLVRDSSGFKKLVRLDLNSKSIISSEYFFLQPNDVLYVEANDAKVASTDAYRNREIALYSAGLSIVLIVVSRILFR
jgi:polysaccharide export outer membrane protein